MITTRIDIKFINVFLALVRIGGLQYCLARWESHGRDLRIAQLPWLDESGSIIVVGETAESSKNLEIFHT